LLEQGVQRVGADSVQGIELGAGHLHAASLPANGPPEQLPLVLNFRLAPSVTLRREGTWPE